MLEVGTNEMKDKKNTQIPHELFTFVHVPPTVIIFRFWGGLASASAIEFLSLYM